MDNFRWTWDKVISQTPTTQELQIWPQVECMAQKYRQTRTTVTTADQSPSNARLHIIKIILNQITAWETTREWLWTKLNRQVCNLLQTVSRQNTIPISTHSPADLGCRRAHRSSTNAESKMEEVEDSLHSISSRRSNRLLLSRSLSRKWKSYIHTTTASAVSLHWVQKDWTTRCQP